MSAPSLHRESTDSLITSEHSLLRLDLGPMFVRDLYIISARRPTPPYTCSFERRHACASALGRNECWLAVVLILARAPRLLAKNAARAGK